MVNGYSGSESQTEILGRDRDFSLESSRKVKDPAGKLLFEGSRILNDYAKRVKIVLGEEERYALAKEIYYVGAEYFREVGKKIGHSEDTVEVSIERGCGNIKNNLRSIALDLSDRLRVEVEKSSDRLD